MAVGLSPPYYLFLRNCLHSALSVCTQLIFSALRSVCRCNVPTLLSALPALLSALPTLLSALPTLLSALPTLLSALLALLSALPALLALRLHSLAYTSILYVVPARNAGIERA